MSKAPIIVQNLLYPVHKILHAPHIVLSKCKQRRTDGDATFVTLYKYLNSGILVGHSYRDIDNQIFGYQCNKKWQIQ